MVFHFQGLQADSEIDDDFQPVKVKNLRLLMDRLSKAHEQQRDSAEHAKHDNAKQKE